MNNTPVFVMPVKIKGDEADLRFFRASVESIKRQTDKDWKIVMVEDFSDDKRVYDVIDEMKKDLKDKLHVIYSDKNYGTGAARNTGVRYAHEIGAPFILYNDSDDLSDPRRLELVRKAFEKDDSVNVVYTSFDVIDENDEPVPNDRIALPVREIIEGHK
ncbi:MAG: glycosyltransferase, partial [Clostridia bacterium]|nr:glycosyltransferase [Clostridia bacterium]